MKNGGRRSGEVLVFLATAALVWLYTWLRAVSVQFSIDEAATFFMYVQTGRFLPPNAVIDANNHILNSFLTWCCYHILGSGSLALRLPNVLAAPVYFYFTWKLAGLFHHKVIRWVFISLFLGVHFIIEFFSYSRGYGLSMAFLTGSVWYLIKSIHEIKFTTILKGLFMALLSVLSNFNLIFTGLTIVLLIIFLTGKQRKNLSSKTLFSLSATLIFLVIPVFVYIIFTSFSIRTHEGFYYGAADGFYAVTVKSLARMLSGSNWLIFILFAALLSAMTITLQILLFRRDRSAIRHHQPVLVVFCLLVANWAGPLLLHIIWRVNFQEDRAAMHLIPLFLLWLPLSLDNLGKEYKNYYWIGLIPLLLIPWHSFSKASLQSSIYGPRQQIPDSYIETIRQSLQGEQFPPVVSAWQTRKQPWAMINYRSGGLLNPIQSAHYPSRMADFLIIEDDIPDSAISGYKTVLEDRPTRSRLLARRTPCKKSLISSTQPADIPDVPSDYKEIISIPLKEAQLTDVLISVRCRIESECVPLQAAIVAEVFDAHRNNLIYEAIDLDQLRNKWQPPSGEFAHCMLIEAIPPQAETLLLYIWNRNQVPVSLRDCSITVSALKD